MNEVCRWLECQRKGTIIGKPLSRKHTFTEGSRVNAAVFDLKIELDNVFKLTHAHKHVSKLYKVIINSYVLQYNKV